MSLGPAPCPRDLAGGGEVSSPLTPIPCVALGKSLDCALPPLGEMRIPALLFLTRRGMKLNPLQVDGRVPRFSGQGGNVPTLEGRKRIEEGHSSAGFPPFPSPPSSSRNRTSLGPGLKPIEGRTPLDSGGFGWRPAPCTALATVLVSTVSAGSGAAQATGRCLPLFLHRDRPSSSLPPWLLAAETQLLEPLRAKGRGRTSPPVETRSQGQVERVFQLQVTGH